MTLQQVHEAMTEIHYAKIEYVPGKGKKNMSNKVIVTAVNCNLLCGVLHFWDETAKLVGANCPSFCDHGKTVTGPTLRLMFEKKVQYRIDQRTSWGKGHNVFHETGDGDFPDMGPDQQAPKDFQDKYTCAQIDDIIDSHLMQLAEQEAMQRNRSEGGNGGAASALAQVSEQQLVLFQAPLAAHAFGKALDPAAQEGSVSKASTTRRSANPGGAVVKRGRDTDGIEKSLSFANSVVSLGDKMLLAMKKPDPLTAEELDARTRSTVKIVSDAVSCAVVEGIREWKKPCEPTPAKPTFLSAMGTAQLLQSIRSIGPAFSNHQGLASHIADIGLTGNILSKLADTEIKELLAEAGLSTVLSNVLLGQFKSWSECRS
jgi:hypothetical protein